MNALTTAPPKPRMRYTCWRFHVSSNFAFRLLFILIYLGDCVPVKKILTNEAENVLKILQNAQEIAERVTMIKLLEAWHGKGNKKLRVKDIPAPELTSIDCQRFLIQLILDGILNEDFHFTPFSTISYLVPGLRANNILAGKVSVSMVLSSETSTKVL